MTREQLRDAMIGLLGFAAAEEQMLLAAAPRLSHVADHDDR